MPNTPNFIHRKFNHLNNPLHSTRGSVSFNMSLHIKSWMTPSSHSNMSSAYKIKKSYFAPTHFFANANFFNYFGQLQNPLITLSKWRFQLRYACFCPWMDNRSLHTCLASSGLQTILNYTIKNHGFLIHLSISHSKL